ncbi:MAG: hypothetical protein JO353_12500, partial [Phycisphaerae bacterium]|nr:hypothetical protein [Phycisphaerae bacterium]
MMVSNSVLTVRAFSRLLFLCGILIAAAVLIAGCNHAESTSPPGAENLDRLITGKAVSPSPQAERIGNLPINMILSSNGKYALASDMGYQESLWAIRTSDGHVISKVGYTNARARVAATQTAPRGGEANQGGTAPGSYRSSGLYYGLAASPDGTIFASQGNHDTIAVLQLDDQGLLNPVRTIKTGKGDFPAGLALDGRGLLYAANNAVGMENPFRSTGSIAIYSNDGQPLGRCELPDRYHHTTGFPLGIAAEKSGQRVFIGSERDDAVYAIDCGDPKLPKVAATIDVGAHPVGLLLNRDDSRLYVANSESDTISIIDTASARVNSTVLLRPQEARGLRGCTPVSLALSPDEHSLYAALADMNAIAVVDLTAPAGPTLIGYLSTGWYPSAVVATKDGRRLLVTDAKGSSARNPNGHLNAATQPSTSPSSERKSYVLNLLEGDVRVINLPADKEDLKRSTMEVLRQNSLPPPQFPVAERIAAMGLSSHRIEHVIYVIKENRTYDQVFGDMAKGNGDPSLTIFGKDITPNLHALAERFVLLDNCYCCGDVSGDGWNWSTQGMANAFVQRNVPYNYSGRGRKFDFEGMNNGYVTGGYPTTGEATVPTTNPLVAHAGFAIPDVGSNGDHLWDEAARAHVSLRNYGFYLSIGDAAAGVVGGPDNLPTSSGLRPGGHDLAGVTDIDYRRFDLDYADSDAPSKFFTETGDARYLYSTATFGKSKSPSRIAEWRREFDLMLQNDSSGSSVPALTLIRLPNDHTAGMKADKHSPSAMVADNDYAIGELVDAVSHSPIWKSTAIFIIEDDAQSGEDHVDCHRTTCQVISPWIKAGVVDHRFYNTDSVLRTMELLLGLPPMTQYEAIAAPIDDWDSSASNSAAFYAIVPSRQLMIQENP